MIQKMERLTRKATAPENEIITCRMRRNALDQYICTLYICNKSARGWAGVCACVLACVLISTSAHNTVPVLLESKTSCA